jgi:hypothetical protein
MNCIDPTQPFVISILPRSPFILVSYAKYGKDEDTNLIFRKQFPQVTHEDTIFAVPSLEEFARHGDQVSNLGG